MRQPSLPNLCKGFAGHIHTHEIEEKCLSVCVKDDSFTKKVGPADESSHYKYKGQKPWDNRADSSYDSKLYDSLKRFLVRKACRPANPPGISGFIPEKICLPAAPHIG